MHRWQNPWLAICFSPTRVHKRASGTMGLSEMGLDYSHLPLAIFSPIRLIRPSQLQQAALVRSLIACLHRGWGVLGSCSVPVSA